MLRLTSNNFNFMEENDIYTNVLNSLKKLYPAIKVIYLRNKDLVIDVENLKRGKTIEFLYVDFMANTPEELQRKAIEYFIPFNCYFEYPSKNENTEATYMEVKNKYYKISKKVYTYDQSETRIYFLLHKEVGLEYVKRMIKRLDKTFDNLYISYDNIKKVYKILTPKLEYLTEEAKNLILKPNFSEEFTKLFPPEMYVFNTIDWLVMVDIQSLAIQVLIKRLYCAGINKETFLKFVEFIAKKVD